MNGSLSTTDGSAKTADAPELTVDNVSLTVDDKLDKIMEAVAFQTKLLASALIAFDKQLQQKDKKIIQPMGLI